MKLGILAASVAAVALGAGTASAQPVVLVPHRDHYHIVPAYPAYPPAPAFGYRSFQPGLSFGFSFGSQPAFGPGFGAPRVYGPVPGYGSGYRPGGFTPGWNGGRSHNGHYHR